MGDSWLPGTLPLLYPTPPKGQKKKEAKPGSSNSSIKHLTFHFPPSGVGGGKASTPPQGFFVSRLPLPAHSVPCQDGHFPGEHPISFGLGQPHPSP